MADAVLVGWSRGNLQARFPKSLPTQYHANTYAGKCVGCGCQVFVNASGAQHLRERDCDLVCELCESRHHADITKSLA